MWVCVNCVLCKNVTSQWTATENQIKTYVFCFNEEPEGTDANRLWRCSFRSSEACRRDAEQWAEAKHGGARAESGCIPFLEP